MVMGGCSSSSESNVDEEEQHDPKLDANGSHCIHEIENPAILIPDFVPEKQLRTSTTTSTIRKVFYLDRPKRPPLSKNLTLKKACIFIISSVRPARGDGSTRMAFTMKVQDNQASAHALLKTNLLLLRLCSCQHIVCFFSQNSFSPPFFAAGLRRIAWRYCESKAEYAFFHGRYGGPLQTAGRSDPPGCFDRL